MTDKLGISAFAALSLALTGVAGTPAAAWEPTKQIELVSHTTETGSTYQVGMAIVRAAEELKLLPHGAKVVVMRGAGGNKARQYVAQDRAGDPHVMQILTPSQINNPILLSSEIDRSNFRGVAIVADEPLLMIVNAKSPYHSIQDIVDAARANPGKILQGGGDFGQVASLVGKLFADSQDVKITYTPFDDEGVLQLLGGHVDFLLENPSQVRKFVEAGRMRIVGAPDKLSFAPEVPTYEEAGFKFQVLRQYRGLWMAKDTPDEVVAFYRELLRKAVQAPSYKKFLEANSLEPVWTEGDELEALLDSEAALYRKLDIELNLIKPSAKQ